MGQHFLPKVFSPRLSASAVVILESKKLANEVAAGAVIPGTPEMVPRVHIQINYIRAWRREQLRRCIIRLRQVLFAG